MGVCGRGEGCVCRTEGVCGEGGQGECLREGWWSAARGGAFHHFSGFEQYLVAYALA